MGFSESMESLKGFDPNDIDFNNAGSWPSAVKSMVFLVVFTVVVFAGYWFLIKDQYVALDKAVAEEVELRKKYEGLAYQVSNLDAYRLQMEDMENSFGALLKQLPADTEVPGLLEDITNTGLGSGLDIESIKLKPEASKEFYVELPMDIEVIGTYHDIASFVSGVASLPRIVTLHNFTISPIKQKKDGQSGLHKMSVAAKTYRYNGDKKALSKKKKGKGGKK